MHRYPEHEKTGHNEFAIIEKFVDFVEEIRMKRAIEPREALYKFFEIDEEKLEKERRQMMEDE